MEVSRENVNELTRRLDVLRDKVRLDEKKMEAEELRLRQQDPEFWTDQERATDVSRKLKQADDFIKGFAFLEDAVTECQMYIDEDPAGYAEELSAAYENALKALDEYELYNMFSEEGDNMSCAVKITAGAGGTEAQDWAKMLTRMYLMYCTQHNFGTDVTDYNEVAPGLLKSATILVEGPNAYGLLKCETGIHRLVRVSPYNAQGKRMTSFASVFVTPIVDDNIEIDIDKSRLEEELFKRSKGAGGQNVNKVATACRLTYHYTDPDTGENEDIVVENHETRKQKDNRERAMLILRSILYKKELDKKNAAKKLLEDSKADIGWGAQIRSYVFDDSRVKDHRTGYQESDVPAVMNGKLDGFIRAFLMSKY
jgi:peptide chain release factor 2